jgi:multidrug efflux pump subunit AcrA (membrane-fusion protein)
LKNIHATAVALAVATLLGACSPDKPPVAAPRPVRTVEIHYDAAREANRYAGTVQSRFEVDHAFRVGGKVAQRKVDVGQFVHEGDVLAVLDDSDYRLAAEVASQQWTVAVAQARQAEADRKRLGSLKADGSVSVADDEHAHSGSQTAQASEEAQARQLELARNRLKYTVLRASRSGVVTGVRLEVGQVVAEGQPVVAIADPGTPEIVVDVPEDQLTGGGADAHLPRPAQAGERPAAAAGCDRHAGVRPGTFRCSSGGDSRHRAHPGQRPSGGLAGQTCWQ